MLKPKSTGSKVSAISLKIPSKNYINKLEHTVISKNSGLQKFEYSMMNCEKKPAALVQINSPPNKNLTNCISQLYLFRHSSVDQLLLRTIQYTVSKSWATSTP